jgi:uncharacterized membrane protein
MERHRTIAVQEQLPALATGLEWLATVIELFAVAILLVGLARFAASYLRSELAGGPGLVRSSQMNSGRIVLARYILAALEVFIVADLLMTVLTLSIESLAFLESFFCRHRIRGPRAASSAAGLMAVLASGVVPGSEEFRANRAAHLAALAEVAAAAAAAAEGGGKPARDRHRARGKMPPRERVANLLDPGAPFWKSAPPPRMACTTAPPPAPG